MSTPWTTTARRCCACLFLSIRDLPCPTLAAINGAAIGAGFCVALGCDFRYASQEAKLGLNFTRVGVHPGMAATWNLPRLVGPGMAAELLYTSRLVDGDEAVRVGLVNRAMPRGEVLLATQAAAAEIAGNAPLAVRAVKQALRRSESQSLEDQLQFEASEQAKNFESADAHEGLAAIREKMRYSNVPGPLRGLGIALGLDSLHLLLELSELKRHRRRRPEGFG